MLNRVENNAGFFKKQHSQYCSSLQENDINAFASLNDDKDRFAFVYSSPFVKSNQISPASNGKNIEVAKRVKEDGNKAFQSGDYATALANYSKAILNCPIDNNELSVIFANRSAVFYRVNNYEKSLADIESALQFNYPVHLSYKIYDRKAKCFLALKQHESAIDAFRHTLTSLDCAKLPLEKRQKWQKDIQIMLAMLTKNSSTKTEKLQEARGKIPSVSGKRNDSHPAVSDSVIFTSSEETGRFAVASRDIKSGDIVAVEEPHCSALLSERIRTHCFQCFKRLIAPLPCPSCCDVAFCSKTCQETAMASHHKNECTILPTIWASGASITCHLALRMFTQKNLEYFKNLKPSLEKKDVKLEETSFSSDDYRSVFYLENNAGQRSVEDMLHRAHMAAFLFKCLKATGYFHESDYTNGDGSDTRSQISSDEIYIGGLMLHNLQFLQFNAHEVSELEMKDRDLDKATSLFLGGAIYPTLSMFNHSCNPGIVRYFQGATVICRAIRMTLEGEMLAENYGPNFTQMPKSERQDALKKQYWFECKCTACTEDWQLFDEMDDSRIRFRCKTVGCNNSLYVPTDTLKFMALCLKCNQHMNLLKGLKALQDTDGMFRVARSFMSEGNIKKALAKLLELLQMLEEILAPPFKDFHLCQQAARTCMLALGNRSDVLNSVFHITATP